MESVHISDEIKQFEEHFEQVESMVKQVRAILGASTNDERFFQVIQTMVKPLSFHATQMSLVNKRIITNYNLTQAAINVENRKQRAGIEE